MSYFALYKDPPPRITATVRVVSVKCWDFGFTLARGWGRWGSVALTGALFSQGGQVAVSPRTSPCFAPEAHRALTMSATLPHLLKDAEFTVYAKHGCVFCDKAEEVLQEFGHPYEKVYDSEYTRFPQIFMNKDNYVGMYQDLVCMLREADEPILAAPKTYTLVATHQDLWAYYKKQVPPPPSPRDVLEWLTTIGGGGGEPPPPLYMDFIVGKNEIYKGKY